jgi:hypothetical protein
MNKQEVFSATSKQHYEPFGRKNEMVVCEICKQSRDETDVLCPTCRETINRLAEWWQENPSAPAGAAVGKSAAQTAPSPKDKEFKRRRFRSFSLFERARTLPYAG